MSAPIRLLVAGADAPTGMGIRLALADDGLVVTGEPADADDAIALALADPPDVCLLDEALPGGCLAAIETIHRHAPAVKLLVLTGSERPAALVAAIHAGVSGYLRTDQPATRMPATIRGVLAGEAALSRRLTYALLEAMRPADRVRAHRPDAHPGGRPLTARELEVLELLAEGFSTGAIAALLAITPVTVRRHVSSAVERLGVADRDEAIALLDPHAGRSGR
ncbi:response regulator transcription factor [Paraconexibacter antarcticus]|uniref:Response regulator transcription factor n=1 Tax=Paraconexibacter antarcticus TaxID=2949664 RepID=A0ABY5DTU7_9ACTN|nr:response regulator transcription factor [Paraconexibacter antarcticus]UTI64396.1 response regulator transcription factor [Paraconexibacter antarcticus]